MTIAFSGCLYFYLLFLGVLNLWTSFVKTFEYLCQGKEEKNDVPKLDLLRLAENKIFTS